jgi:hypothetical protein
LGGSCEILKNNVFIITGEMGFYKPATIANGNKHTQSGPDTK